MTEQLSRTSEPGVSPGNPDITGLAKRGLSSLVGAGVSALANLALIVVVTRGVGQETAGYFFAATSVFVVLEGLCALGTVTGVVYYIARLRARGHPAAVPVLLRTAVRPVGVAAIVAGLLVFWFAEQLSVLMGAGSAGEPVVLLRVLAIFLPLAVLHDVAIAATQGFHTMRPTVRIERIGRPVAQLLLLALAVMSGLAWTLSLAWAGPYLMGFALAALAVARLLRADRGVPGEGAPVEPVSTKEFWRYTAPRGLAAVAQLSLQRLDIILVAFYLGAGPAAIYTAATRFVVLGQLGSQAVALAVQPKFSELMALGDVASTRRVYQTSTAWVLAITWPIHLVVAVCATMLMQVFGEGYESGRWVVVILAGAMLVATGCGMVTMLLVMAGRTAANLMNVAVALVTNISLNIVLIPAWGIVGAAVAWAVAIVLCNLLPLVQIQRAFGLNPFGRGSVAVAGLALVTVGLLPGAWLLLGDSQGPVVVLTVVGLALHAAGLWRLRGLLELEELVDAVRRRGGRRHS